MIYAEGIDEPNMFDKCACLWLLEDVTDREQQIVRPMEPDCLPTGRKYALILNYMLNSCMNDDNLICVFILDSKFMLSPSRWLRVSLCIRPTPPSENRYNNEEQKIIAPYLLLQVNVQGKFWASCSVSWRNNWRPPSNNCVQPLLISWKIMAGRHAHCSIACLSQQVARDIQPAGPSQPAEKGEVSSKLLSGLNHQPLECPENLLAECDC